MASQQQAAQPQQQAPFPQGGGAAGMAPPGPQGQGPTRQEVLLGQAKEVAADVVVQAKEAAQGAAHAVSEFFQGNPFGSPVGEKIGGFQNSNLLFARAGAQTSV